ncbi:hypothetical protein ACXVUM_18875 [Williamsia sp. SKLECPSW1]
MSGSITDASRPTRVALSSGVTDVADFAFVAMILVLFALCALTLRAVASRVSR